jgi:hypothetical protein
MFSLDGDRVRELKGRAGSSNLERSSNAYYDYAVASTEVSVPSKLIYHIITIVLHSVCYCLASLIFSIVQVDGIVRAASYVEPIKASH